MSTNNQPGREKEIFEEAIELVSPEAQLGYVKGACGGDAELLARVQTLLRAHGESGGFLPESPGAAGATIQFSPAESAEKPGTVIGRYKLLEKIGEGGFGSVYMAAQEEPVRRRVALKVIKLGMDTKEVVARFEAERQALAMMDHPNIAKVLDGGATDTGRPYFVMELVKGVPITTYCDQRQLSTQARLELFILVCQAVQHAHQKGIIHRDLKPSNILVTEQDGRPVPKVIDFGVARATQARLTEKTMFTQFHQMVGTPAYMSPEQTGLANLDIDTRSDIYSLGVLLYELLTGCTPFDSKKLLEAGYEGIMRIIREVEPPKPSTRLSSLSVQELSELGGRRQEEPRRLGRLVQGDLDWIVMKALEKDRSRRYETATSLAQDLQRHLGNEPVIARPPSNAYRLQKLLRRHRVACTTGAVMVLTLIAGLVATGWAYVNERDAHRRALDAERLRQHEAQSVITVMRNNARIHRESVANAQKAEIESAKTGYALPLLNEFIAAAASSNAAEKANLRKVLAPLAARLEQDTQMPKGARHSLTELFGDFYAAANDLPRAELLYRQTLALRRELLGEAHSQTAAVLKKLVDVLTRQGKQAEARRAQNDRDAKLKTYLVSERWTKQLRARSHRQQAEGNWAAAETSLGEAVAVTRTKLGVLYDPKPDLGEMARIKYAAGDWSGAEKLAADWIETERTGRQWSMAGPMGIFSIGNAPPPDGVPFDAYTLLGLTALHRGDTRGANEYLLKSGNGFRPELKWSWEKRDIELAAALLAGGERATVVKFIDGLRHRAVALESRVFSFSLIAPVSNVHFATAARGRGLVLKFEGWRREVTAGNAPADWQKLLQVTPQQEIGDRQISTSFETRTRQMPNALSSTPRSLLPIGVLLLGWCSTAAATRFKQRWVLPRSPSRWLAAFCLARTAECAMFTALLLVDGFSPPNMIRVALPLISWILLWEFVRSLAPAEASRREILLFRLAAGIAIAGFAAFEFVYFLPDYRALMITMRVIRVPSHLFWALILIVAPVIAGRRVWAWSGRSELGGPRKLSLKFAAILLGVHGMAALFLPFVCDGVGGPLAVTALWIYALLPWLLLIGFTDFTLSHQASGTPDALPS